MSTNKSQFLGCVKRALAETPALQVQPLYDTMGPFLSMDEASLMAMRGHASEILMAQAAIFLKQRGDALVEPMERDQSRFRGLMRTAMRTPQLGAEQGATA